MNVLPQRPTSGVSPALAARWIREPAAHATAIFVVALAVRLAVSLAMDVDPVRGADDVSFYFSAAYYLASGDGYVYDWRIMRGPAYDAITSTALHPPGYPLTLALVFKLFGNVAENAYILNSALGAATAAIVYLLGRRLFGTAQGLAAGVLAAFFPGQIYFAALTMTEVYAAFLVVLLVYLTVRWSERRVQWYQAAAMSGLAAVAAVVRAELVLFPLALLAVLGAMRVPRERLLLLGGSAVLGALVMAGLWSLSNHRRVGTYHLTTNVGLILIQGHNPDTKGGLQWDTLARSEPGPEVSPSPAVEVQRNDDTFSAAWDYAVHHIPNELRLIFPRLYKLIRDDDAGIRWIQYRADIWGRKVEERMLALGNAYYFGVLGLALFGAPVWWRSRGRGAPFVLPVLYYLIVFSVFFLGDVRYHMPVVPLTTVPAGAVAVAGWEAVRWRSTDHAGSQVDQPPATPASPPVGAPGGDREQ